MTLNALQFAGNQSTAMKHHITKQSNEFLSDRYNLITLIGEGTFAQVYKAVDLTYADHDNSAWSDIANTPPFDHKGKQVRHVAIKKIFAVSSPERVFNELVLLQTLGYSSNVVPLIDVHRYLSTVYLVMPYFQHDDFRYLLHIMEQDEWKVYIRNMVRGLAHVHSKGIIHRDLKPSNFLYDYRKKRGVLVDFGLAHFEEEFEGDEEDVDSVVPMLPPRKPGYYIKEMRPSFHAERAGTRGFRAIEVLLKSYQQTRKLDVWSVGVCLLCLATKQFPFFSSPDDATALVEIACIMGQQVMSQACEVYDREWHSRIPTVPKQRVSFQTIIESLNPEFLLDRDMLSFLDVCFEVDYKKRASSESLLNHPYLKE